MRFGGRMEKIKAFLRSHRKSLNVQMILSYVVLQTLCIFLFLLPATEATRVLKEQANEKAADQALATSEQADSTFTFFRNAGVSLISEKSVSDLAHMMEKNLNISIFPFSPRFAASTASMEAPLTRCICI